MSVLPCTILWHEADTYRQEWQCRITRQGVQVQTPILVDMSLLLGCTLPYTFQGQDTQLLDGFDLKFVLGQFSVCKIVSFRKASISPMQRLVL